MGLHHLWILCFLEQNLTKARLRRVNERTNGVQGGRVFKPCGMDSQGKKKYLPGKKNFCDVSPENWILSNPIAFSAGGLGFERPYRILGLHHLWILCFPEQNLTKARLRRVNERTNERGPGAGGLRDLLHGPSRKKKYLVGKKTFVMILRRIGF